MEIEEKERAEKKKRGAKVTAVRLAALTSSGAEFNYILLENEKDNYSHWLF